MKPEDEAAFRDFVTARSAALLRTAYLLTGDVGMAEDAVQAVFGRVYLTWPRIQHREAAESYCRRALVREVSSWRRRRRVTHVLTDQVPETASTTDADSTERDDRLKTALLALPARQRTVVALRYYADLAETDVADLLGITTGSVKQHAHRALAALRIALDEPHDLTKEAER